MPRPKPPAPPITSSDDGALAMSVADFCKKHGGISTQLFYKLAKRGEAPATFRVGNRVLVSKESAAQWRREREAANKK